jgi:hypothetical protein
MPESVHCATVPAAPKSRSSGWAATASTRVTCESSRGTATDGKGVGPDREAVGLRRGCRPGCLAQTADPGGVGVRQELSGLLRPQHEEADLVGEPIRPSVQHAGQMAAQPRGLGLISPGMLDAAVSIRCTMLVLSAVGEHGGLGDETPDVAARHRVRHNADHGFARSASRPRRRSLRRRSRRARVCCVTSVRESCSRLQPDN